MSEPLEEWAVGSPAWQQRQEAAAALPEPPPRPLPRKPPAVSHGIKHSLSYKVWKGETAWIIALRFHCSVEELLLHNGIDDPRRIKAGTVLNIPPAAGTALVEAPS